MDPAIYDYEMQMYIEPVHLPNVAVLDFWRWLVETGRLTGDDDNVVDARH